MDKAKLEFGRSLVEELERLITSLDPRLTKLDLERTLEYMIHIRGKMFEHYYIYGEQTEVKGQIVTMQKCIDTVRKMLDQKNASPM